MIIMKKNRKEVKALILDLDDTLWDTTSQLVRKGQIAALKEMARHGLPIKVSDAAKVRDMLVKRYGSHINITKKAAEHFGPYKKGKKYAERIAFLGHHKYHSVKIGKIKPFRDTISTLKKLKKSGKIIVLLSYGVPKQQNRKINMLGIRRYLDRIVFDTTIGKSNKSRYLKKIIKWLRKKGMQRNEIILVGDKINSEIEDGKRLGLRAVRIRSRGRYSKLKPKNKWQNADYTIKELKSLLKIVNS